MTPALVVGAVTDTGMVRAHNEDALLVDVEQRLVAVADGLGGHRAGEVASALAVKTVREVVRARAAAARADPRRCEVLLADALVQADETIRQAARAHDERAGMGSTAVVAWFPDGRLVLANVGDSRGYLLREGDLRQLTQDHTVLEALRRAGRLSGDLEDQPPRQILSQALGPGAAVFPSVATCQTASGDQVLLCSDGLTDLLTDTQIGLVLAATASVAPQKACEVLVSEANRRGGFDNVTAVLVRLDPHVDAEP